MKFKDALKEFYTLISPYLEGGQKTFISIVYSFITCLIKHGDFPDDKIIIPRIYKKCPSKPDEFILFFFKDIPALKIQYSKEIKGKKMKILRREFKILYPMIVLKDSFLNLVFAEEIKNKNYYKISKIYTKRRKEIIASINKIKESLVFEDVKKWVNMVVKTFFEEFIDNKKFREFIFEKLSKNNPY